MSESKFEREKILIICKYEKWCVNWFNMLLRYLAYNVYSENKSEIKVNKRHRCVCLPEKEIIFVPEAMANTKMKNIKVDKVINWEGHDVNELWNKI